jgi:hypothetical protein
MGVGEVRQRLREESMESMGFRLLVRCSKIGLISTLVFFFLQKVKELGREEA